MRDAGHLQHLSNLWELLNVDIVEHDFVAVVADLFLHEGLEHLARTAPGSGTLEYYRDLAVNNLIPLVDACHHSVIRLGAFAGGLSSSRLVVRAEAHTLHSLRWSCGTHHNSLRAGHRDLLLIGSCLLLHDETSHVSSDNHLCL